MAKKKGKPQKAPRGALKARILGELHRGAKTAPQIADALKANRTMVYQTLNRLLREGVAVKSGRVKGKRGKNQRFRLVPAWKPKAEKAALRADELGDVTVNSLLRAFREITGADLQIERGTGGRAGKGLYLQVARR